MMMIQDTRRARLPRPPVDENDQADEALDVDQELAHIMEDWNKEDEGDKKPADDGQQAVVILSARSYIITGDNQPSKHS